MIPTTNQPPNTSIRSLWLFGLTILPYGASTNFIQTTVPFLLSKAGVPVHTIATISAICWCPFFLSFLWAPLVDLGWKRRNVIVLSGICAAAVLCLATLVLPSRNLVAFTALGTLAVALSTFSSAATGGLMATLVPVEHRGRAGGWFQVGIMAGGALSAGVTMWCAGKFGIAAAAFVLAAFAAVPCLAALWPRPLLQAAAADRGRRLRASRKFQLLPLAARNRLFPAPVHCQAKPRRRKAPGSTPRPLARRTARAARKTAPAPRHHPTPPTPEGLRSVAFHGSDQVRRKLTRHRFPFGLGGFTRRTEQI